MGYFEDVIGAAAGAIGIMLIFQFLSIALSVTMYVLQSLGLYTIAQRREIKHPWLAWLPVGNVWILGSISDQYQYVSQGLVRSRRKLLLALQIAVVVVMVVFFVMYISWFINLFMQIPVLETMPEEEVFRMIGGMVGGVLVVCLVMMVVAIVATVFQYICLYNLYASCDPGNKGLFLVLSILVNVTMPFLIFACRKKDGGMPPRRDTVVNPLPLYGAPAQEPWNTVQ